MKKVISVLMMCIVIFGASACTPAAALRLSSVVPWMCDNVFTEKTVYSVERKNNSGASVAEGTLTNIVYRDNATKLFVHSSEFNLIYPATFDTEERTDSIITRTVFTSTSLAPVYSYKKRTITGEINYSNIYSLSERDSYEFSAVYSDFELDGTSYTKGATGNFQQMSSDEITFNMKHSTYDFYADNEYLFYFVRSIHGLDTGYNNSFNLYNVFDAFTKKSPSLSAKGVTVSVADSASAIYINKDLISENGGQHIFKGILPEDESALGSVDALKTTIRLSGDKSGTAIAAYYSKPVSESLDVLANNRKVLLGINYTESIVGHASYFTMSFRLKDFSTTL